MLPLLALFQIFAIFVRIVLFAHHKDNNFSYYKIIL